MHFVVQFRKGGAAVFFFSRKVNATVALRLKERSKWVFKSQLKSFSTCFQGHLTQQFSTGVLEFTLAAYCFGFGVKIIKRVTAEDSAAGFITIHSIKKPTECNNTAV